jgi:hypothetical protein
MIHNAQQQFAKDSRIGVLGNVPAASTYEEALQLRLRPKPITAKNGALQPQGGA